MATIQQQHDQERKLVHKQFNSPIGLYSEQNVKETLDREIKAFGGSGIELDNQYLGKSNNLQNSAVLKMLEEEESERYTAKRMTTERQSRQRQRCLIDRNTVLKINRRHPKRDYSWPPPDSICSRSRSSSEEHFNEEIRHKHDIDHIKQMFDSGVIFQHKNISTINKLISNKNSEPSPNVKQFTENCNSNKFNIRSRSLNDNFRGNNNAKYNNELPSSYNSTETFIQKDNAKNCRSESLVKKMFYLPENEQYIGMVEPTCKHFEQLSKNCVYPLHQYPANNELSSDGLSFEKKWKSNENFIDFHSYDDNNSETRTKHDSSQKIFNSSTIILKSDNNNFSKTKNTFTPATATDPNTTNRTNNIHRTLSLDRRQQKKGKYNSNNSFKELPPLKPRGEYHKNLPSNNKTKLNLNNTQNNNIMKIMENPIPNKTTTSVSVVGQDFNKKLIQKLENCNKKSTEVCKNQQSTNLNHIKKEENMKNFQNDNSPSHTKHQKSTINFKISSNNNSSVSDSIILSDNVTKTNNSVKSSPTDLKPKNKINSNNRNKISYSSEPNSKEKNLLNFHEKFQPSDNINNSSNSSSSSSSRSSHQHNENKTEKKYPKENINGMQKNIIICNISDADESTKIKTTPTTKTIQNENINNKNDNKIQEMGKNFICTRKITKTPSPTGTEIFEAKINDGLEYDGRRQNEIFILEQDNGDQPNKIINFPADNKIYLVQGSQYKNYNLISKNSTVTTNTDGDNFDQEENNINKNIRSNNYLISSSSSSSSVPTRTLQIKRNELVKQNSPLNLTRKDNFIENLPINLNENIKKNMYIPDMIITSDGINRIVNIINLNQNKDLQNSTNNKLYNQSTTFLSSLLPSSAPMNSKDFLNGDKKPYREINVNRKNFFCDSITQDNNKKNLVNKNENDENLVKSFLQEQENIALVVKTKNNENNQNDDKKYSCLETKNIDTEPTDKAINITNNNKKKIDTNSNNTKVKTVKQTTNTITPISGIKKIYYKTTNECIPSSNTDQKNQKRYGIYYTDGTDIWQKDDNDLKTIDLIYKENDYKQVQQITDDKLNDLLLKYENVEKICLNNNENEFKMKTELKMNNNINDYIDKNTKENLLPIDKNITEFKNNIEHENNELQQTNLPLTTNALHGKYSKIQKSIGEDLRHIDHYMESTEKSLCNLEPTTTDNIIIFETPLKKIMKHFMFNSNNYNPISIANDTQNHYPYQLLTNQAENMPVVENVLVDLYNISLVLDNLNETTNNQDDEIITNKKTNTYENPDKAHIIEINDNYEELSVEDHSKDETNSILSNTTITETLSTNSEPTTTITFDKIIQSKNILSGYLITKQNQEELFEKASSVINQLQDTSAIDQYNINYLDSNNNYQHEIKSKSPSYHKTNVQEHQQNFEKHTDNDYDEYIVHWKENLKDNLNSLKFNDEKLVIISHENDDTNNITKIDLNNKMNEIQEDNIINDNNNNKNHHHKNNNRIADSVEFKIDDKSLNFKYENDDNRQIHHLHHHHLHEKNQNSDNVYPQLTTFQNVHDDIINKEATILKFNEKAIKRSTPKTKIQISAKSDDDNNTDNNNNVNDNKSNEIDCANKTPNDKQKIFKIIPSNDLILTTSNQIELSTAGTVQLAKLVDTNELTPSPTLSAYDNNNICEKCDNTTNSIMMMMMPEINFDKQQRIQYNYETKSRNFINNNVLVNGDDDNVVDDGSYRQAASGDNITNITTGTNKNNYGIMNTILKDVDNGRCGIMKNSINGEYSDNDTDVNRKTITTECYYLSNNEQYNKLSNEIFDDMETYIIENNKNQTCFNDNEISYYKDSLNQSGNYNSPPKDRSMSTERSRSRVRFIDTITDEDKPIYKLRCTSQPPPIKHLVKVSKDFINFDSRNYYNVNRQRSYDSNINNTDSKYLMSSPTLQLYPFDGQYEWTDEGYKRVAWPPADQNRTFRAYTPTPQPNQQPNQDNNSYQSQPTQSQYPQQPYSGGQSYDPRHQQQQQQQSQHHQPQQSNPQSQYQQQISPQSPSYQPANQGYQKPNYPGANQPSSQQGYQPQQSRPQQSYPPQQSQQGYQPQKSQPEQGYVHALNQQPSSQQSFGHPLNQSQPHSPQQQQQQQQQPNPNQHAGYVPYPHQENNYPSSNQTSSTPSHMNGPGSTVSFAGGVAQRPAQSAGLPQYNPQPKPFQSQYNVPHSPAQSHHQQQQHQQQPVQTGDEQHRGWTHVALPAPVRSGYTQEGGYQPNTAGGVQAAPQYGSDRQFGSNQNISNQQQPTNQAYHQSMPVNPNQPSSGQQQQFYQQPQPQQQTQMHPAQNQYHQPSYESQNNQYNQQPQQQYNSQADNNPPGVITLRRETPTHKPPAAVIVSQPATKSFRGGSIMRGDLKWPPQDCRERMEADAEWERQLSMGPACRPTKQAKDYSGFFAQHALSHNYPGYKIPPGTQHIEASY